jgi:teichuronic acid biosynthesis glycosyltransferase TuaG
MLSTEPTISVVIPAYNAAPYIAETLFSILGQSLSAYEVIIVDDYSKDNTYKVVEEIAKKNSNIRLIKTNKNFGGPAGPRNIGILAASGDLIAFCDADDVWHPDKLKLQLAAYVKSSAALVGCSIKNFRGEDPQVILAQSRTSGDFYDVSYFTMLCKDVLAMSGVMCKRDVLFQTGLFNEAQECISVEDYQLWLRIMRHPEHRAVKLKSVLVAYRIVNTSLSSNRLRHMRKIRQVVFHQLISAHGWIQGLLLLPFTLIGYVYLAIYWRWIKKGL